MDSPDFDRLLLATVRATYPAHEQERFVAHLRGLVGQWVRENGREPGLGLSAVRGRSAVVDEPDERAEQPP